jgi:hypothetical protein
MAESLGGSVEHDNGATTTDGIYYNNGSSRRLSLDYHGGVSFSGSFSSKAAAAAADLKPKRRSSMGRSSFPENDDILNLLHGSDPVKVELNRLENELRGK